MKNLLHTKCLKTVSVFLLILITSCKTVAPLMVQPSKKNPKPKILTTKTTDKSHKTISSKAESEKIINENTDREETQVLEATTSVKVTTQLVLDYIDRFQKIAKDDMATYGIPASITLGQGILESGAGTGPLSRQANNHFGIKCHLEWNGASIKHDDDEAQECFRKYENADESYRDHALFLTSRSRYSKLFKLSITDYKSWAKGLRAAGYATDPKYPDKLISIIERYNLQQYDTENYATRVVEKSEISNLPPKYEENLHVVQKGDTLYSISKKYNTTIEEIKKNNNMTDSSISIGQNIKLK